MAVILITSIQLSSCGAGIRLVKTTHLKTVPSASSLEFYNNQLYIIGDDATKVFITDVDHNLVDSIPLFPSEYYRIDKAEKADLESSFIMNESSKPMLVAYSSFSTTKRNKIVGIDLLTKKTSINNAEISLPLLAEMNIEGAAIIGSNLMLSNRANTTHRDNHFIVADTAGFFQGNKKNGLKIIKIALPPSSSVVGISGLAYNKEKDLLLFTASTEDTPNAYTDGAIGESYIGFIDRFSTKLSQQGIKADRFFKLSKYIRNKEPQKIESVAIQQLKGKHMIVHLAADNDNGQSTIIKMNVRVRD